MLLTHAERVIAIFGSTDSCEQLFSKVKFCMNKLRSQLTDNQLNDISLANSSSVEPNIASLIACNIMSPIDRMAFFRKTTIPWTPFFFRLKCGFLKL